MSSLRALAAPGSLALLLFTGARPALQSGRGLMHGYVAFDDFTYNQVSEGAIQARIELRGNTQFNHATYKAETDRHGSWDIPAIGMGQYTLRITAPGHVPYQIELYIPSDFECRLAVMLKKGGG
jgi:hypothetical protein